MRLSTGSALIALGTTVGVAVGVVIATGVHITIPPELVTIALYKLSLGAAGGLIVAGAVMRKRELGKGKRRDELPPGTEG